MRSLIVAIYIFGLLFDSSSEAGIVCDVTKFGARGDGVTINTDAFQRAINTCLNDGFVVVPPGDYVSGPLTIDGAFMFELHLQQGATLLALDNITAWPVLNGQYQDFISYVNGRVAYLSGPGTIDGQGAGWWAAFKNNSLKYQRPMLVALSGCVGVRIYDLTLVDSPMFHVALGAEDAEVVNVTIRAPFDSPNTDGIDPTAANNVWIHNCTISNGDDNVAVKPGSSNVLVEDCSFFGGHGASIGSVPKGNVENVTFRNINFNGGHWGARIKTWQTGHGTVRNITYDQLTMVDVNTPILITMYYSDKDSSKASPDSTDTIAVSDVVFSNILSTGNSTIAGQFLCLNDGPCRNITMTNINVKAQKHDMFNCTNAYGTATNVTPRSCLQPQ